MPHIWGQCPFPASETLCYFVTSLTQEGIAPATIRKYLAAVRHAQIMRGHPEPQESSSLPRLRLVQNGVRRERASSGPSPPTRLLITPPHLRQLRAPAGSALSYKECLLWATAAVCFFQLLSRGRDYGPQRISFRPESAPGVWCHVHFRGQPGPTRLPQAIKDRSIRLGHGGIHRLHARRALPSPSHAVVRRQLR